MSNYSLSAIVVARGYVKDKHWYKVTSVTRNAAKGSTAVARLANRVSFSCFGYFHGCDLTTATLQAICKEYYERLCKLESEKYDTEYLVRQKDYEVSDMTSPVPHHRHPRAKECSHINMDSPLHNHTLFFIVSSLVSESEARLHAY